MTERPGGPPLEPLPRAVPGSEVGALAERLARALDDGFTRDTADRRQWHEPAARPGFHAATRTTTLWMGADTLVEHVCTSGDNGADNSRAFEYFIQHHAVIDTAGVTITLAGTHDLCDAAVHGSDAARVAIARAVLGLPPT